MSKKIIVPPSQDPIAYFERYRRKALWQKKDYWKGVQLGAVAIAVIATILKVKGII